MGRKAPTPKASAAKVLTKIEAEHLASAFLQLGFSTPPTTVDHARKLGMTSAQRFMHRVPSATTVETVISSATSHVSALARINGLGIDVVAAYVHSFRKHLPEHLQEHEVPVRLLGAMKPKPEPRKRQSGRAA